MKTCALTAPFLRIRMIVPVVKMVVRLLPQKVHHTPTKPSRFHRVRRVLARLGHESGFHLAVFGFGFGGGVGGLFSGAVFPRSSRVVGGDEGWWMFGRAGVEFVRGCA